MNEGAQLSADVLNQLGNNPAMQRQINPLQKVAELVADGKVESIKNLKQNYPKDKPKFHIRNVSAVCTII